MRRWLAKVADKFGIRLSERCTCAVGGYYPRFGSTNAGWTAHADDCPVYVSRSKV